MQNLTTEQKSHLYEGGHVGVTITGETLDGTPVSVTEDDIIEGSFSIDRNWVSGSTIEIGCAETSELVFELDNSDGRWSDLRWEGTRLVVVLDIAGEPLQAGIFTVDEPPRKLTTMQIRALDNMARFNRLYDSTCPYPATLLQILQDACSRCNVTLHTQTFSNCSYVVAQRPEGDDITYHHVVAWVAELAGCNAWIDEVARLRLGWYGDQQPEPAQLEFARDSAAIHPETGAEVGVDTPIFMPFSEDKRGLLMEEGTENLISNPKFEDGLSGWRVGSYLDVSVEDSDCPIASKHAAVTLINSPSKFWFYVSPIDIVPSGTYTVSLWAKIPEGLPVIMNLHDETHSSFSNITVTGNGTWQKYTHVRTFSEDTTKAGVYLYHAGDVDTTFYVTAVQLEAKPYPTSFTDGIRANPSTLLTLPEALPATFGIGIAAKMLHAHDAATRTFWQVGDYRCYFDAADNKIKITNGVVEAETAAVTWAANDIIGVYAGRQNGKLFLQAKIAGALTDRVEAEAGAGAGTGETLYVGSRADGSESVNAVVADLVFHDRPEDIDPMGYLSAIPGGGGE